MGSACCIASLPSCAPEGLHSSDRLDVAEANMYPIPAFPGVSAPTFRPLPEGFGRSTNATSGIHPQVFRHRVSIGFPRRLAEASRCFPTMAPHRALCDRSRMWPKPLTPWSGSSSPDSTEVVPSFEAPPSVFPTHLLSAPKCGLSASLPNRGSPPTRTKSKRSHRARHTAGSRGTFHEVRFLSAKSTQVIVALVCLPSTVRSQGFSPSQRFDPT
jgi:hypothetical protein